MKTFFLIVTLITLTAADDCQHACRGGPTRLPGYICRCPIASRDKISPCIRYCCNDYLCRTCVENTWFGIPSLCPYEIDHEVDLSDCTGSKFKFVFKHGLKIFNFNKAKATSRLFFDPATLEAFAALYMKELVLEGKYEVSGKLCGRKSIRSEGCAKITLDNIDFDWHPKVEIFTKCNVTHFRINGEQSYLNLTINDCVKFDFKEKDRKSECKLSKCANENWVSIFSKIQRKLEAVLSDVATIYTNSIIAPVPVNEVFHDDYNQVFFAD